MNCVALRGFPVERERGKKNLRSGHSGGGEVQVGDTTVTQYCFDECDPGAVLKEAQEKYPVSYNWTTTQ